MKRIFLAAALLTGMATFSAQAQDVNAPTSTIQQEETAVKPESFPDAVKATLASETYAESTVTAAFLVKEGETEYYKIELTNGNEKSVIKLDKNGQLSK